MNLNTMFKEAAIRIGDNLCKNSVVENNGLCWETYGIDSTGKPEKRISLDLYSGISGICLFLIELFKVTQNDKYINYAIKGLQRVSNRILLFKSNSFLTGKMGVAFTLLKLYEITKSDEHKNIAAKIARECDLYMNSNSKCEYISGAAGFLLSLLFVHSKIQDEIILSKIDKIINYIILNAYIGKKGFYWDRSSTTIKGLCGFSHGAAGIGYVFLELGNYFKNSSFYYIAQQAFEYESQFYDKNINNWLDFRKGIYLESEFEELVKAYESQNMDFFTLGRDTFLWCHGGIGIGLSRIRAFELLNKPLYKKQLYSSLRRAYKEEQMLNSYNSSFSLCHGRGGIIDLFLNTFCLLNRKTFLKKAQEIGYRAIDNFEKTGNYVSGFGSLSSYEEDYSLFNGNAGIGYQFLRLMNPSNIQSVLSPKLDKSFDLNQVSVKFKNIHIDINELRRKTIFKPFERTIKTLSNLNANNQFFNINKYGENHLDTLSTIKRCLNTELKKASVKNRAILKDIFKLENAINRCDFNTFSFCYYHINQIKQFEKAKELTQKNEKEFACKNFKINDNVYIINTNYNWDISKFSSPSSVNLKKASTPVLLIGEISEVKEIYLSNFLNQLLQIIIKHKKVESIIYEMKMLIETPLTPKEEEKFNNTIRLQLHNLLLSRIIIECTEIS